MLILLLPLKHHPIKSLSLRFIPSASSLPMTPVSSPPGLAQATSTLIAYHANGNLNLQHAFKTKSHCDCITTFNAIMTRLAAHSCSVDLQIWTMRPALLIRKPSPSSRMPSFSLSHLTCIAATKQNKPFAHSRTTSLQSWLVLMQPFPHSFGTCFSHRLNLP